MRVVGLGHAAGGDDGVGIAVVEWLRTHDDGHVLELAIAAEPSALVTLFDTDSIIIVDAVVGAGPAGRIHDLELAQLERRRLVTPSSHGLDVISVLELACLLGVAPASLRLIGVSVDDVRPGFTLSPAVAAAVPRAAARVLALAAQAMDRRGGRIEWVARR